MPKPYSILAAALVASGRSLSTVTLAAPAGCGRLSRPSIRRLARLAGCAAEAGRPLYGRWVE